MNLDFLLKIPYDKALHMIGGALISAAICSGLILIGIYLWLACFIAAIAVAGAGVYKEIQDSKDPEHHTVDKMDAVYTVAGGIVALLPVIVYALKEVF